MERVQLRVHGSRFRVAEGQILDPGSGYSIKKTGIRDKAALSIQHRVSSIQYRASGPGGPPLSLQSRAVFTISNCDIRMANAEGHGSELDL
jgi:hypothetical protein